MLVQWKPLNVITLVQNKTDSINGIIIITESTAFWQKVTFFQCSLKLKFIREVHRVFIPFINRVFVCTSTELIPKVLTFKLKKLCFCSWKFKNSNKTKAISEQTYHSIQILITKTKVLNYVSLQVIWDQIKLNTLTES